MSRAKVSYLMYWKQLKRFADQNDLGWQFSSFEEFPQTVVKVGSPKCKMTLFLIGNRPNEPRTTVSAGFWIHDSVGDLQRLKENKKSIEAAMGQPLVWDAKLGRKSSWVRVTLGMDIARQEHWPRSFEWFADNVGKLRDVCYQCLG